MSNLSIISIVLYSLSGLLFIVFIIIFFMTDVWSSIKFIKQKGKSNNDSAVIIPDITVEKNNSNNVILKNSVHYESSVSDEIEYAQQTVDVNTLDEENSSVSIFETQNWELPEGVSFVLIKNIIVCHSDKEYMQRGN